MSELDRGLVLNTLRLPVVSVRQREPDLEREWRREEVCREGVSLRSAQLLLLLRRDVIAECSTVDAHRGSV